MENIKIVRTGAKRTIEYREKNQVGYFVFPRIEELGVAEHLFSTRIGGVSKGCYESMNLSYTRGDEKSAVDENYMRIADCLGHGRTLKDFVSTFQTHTTNIRKVTEADRGKGPLLERDYIDIDGLVTDVPGIILSTFHADCPPIYFVDPVKKAIGLSHSGWKGTKGKIAQKTIEAMSDYYGCNPKDIVCAIGPSICGQCYEIGEDVASQFKEIYSNTELNDCNILTPKSGDKYLLNLWNVIKYTLISTGVKEENILITDVCTKCNSDILFSHRVQGEKRGNLAAFLCLK